jgi:serine/threonine protein kinase
MLLLLNLSLDVARAMVHLHDKNVIHGDLKARNVLLKSGSSEQVGPKQPVGRQIAWVHGDPGGGETQLRLRSADGLACKWCACAAARCCSRGAA